MTALALDPRQAASLSRVAAMAAAAIIKEAIAYAERGYPGQARDLVYVALALDSTGEGFAGNEMIEALGRRLEQMVGFEW